MWYWIIGGGALLWLTTRSKSATAATPTAATPTGSTACSNESDFYSRAVELMMARAGDVGGAGGSYNSDTGESSIYLVEFGGSPSTKYILKYKKDSLGNIVVTAPSGYSISGASYAEVCKYLPTLGL